MGGPVGGGRNAGIPTVAPIPLLQPIPALGLASPGFAGGYGRIAVPQPGYGIGAYPIYPVLGGGYAANPAVQNFVVLQTAPPPAVIEVAPPKPIQSTLWEAPGLKSGEQPASEEPRTYSIALKDGSTVSAAAVWVQDSAVHYMDADGGHKQVPLEAIDREITRRLNRAQNLVLRLPPPR